MEIVYQLPSGEETSIHVDAVISESVTVSAEVTTDPVEKGAAITDHVIPNPDTWTIQGFVSNHPLERSNTPGVVGQAIPVELPTPSPRAGNVVGELYDQITGGPKPVSATVLGWSGAFDRPRTVFEELRRIVREGVIVRIVTGFREYPSMVIRELSPTRDASTGNALAFSASAVEVRLVETEIVEIPTLERRGQKKSSRGVQAPKEVPPNSSMAKKLFDHFTGGD